MITFRYIYFIICLLASYAYASAETQGASKAFDGDELKIFCRELPIVLASMNNDEKNGYFKNVIMDYSRALLPESKMHDWRLSLQPQRFAYILNHIILAGVIEDMGGFGEGRLRFLEQERENIKNNGTIPSGEKERILMELDNDINRLHDTIAQAQSIPRLELALIWREKEELNALLRGKIPIQKKQMARH